LISCIPRLTESSVQEYLRAQDIDLSVIVMADHSDVATAVAAMKQGALDFLEKPLNDQMLLDGVHHAVAEDRVRRRHRAWRQMLVSRFKALTPREQDILQQVAEGLSNREIADLLNLSHKTVEVHRAKVMQKMSARHSVATDPDGDGSGYFEALWTETAERLFCHVLNLNGLPLPSGL
jgi:two-component system response regulator FixJ